MITKFDSLFAGHIDMEDVGYGGVPVNDRRFSERATWRPSSTRLRRWPS